MEKDQIWRLVYLCRTYDGINKLIVSSKNRLQQMEKEGVAEYFDEIMIMQKLKNQVSRKIEKALEFWFIWEQWLKKISGIGPFIAANLVILFLYRFKTICPDSGCYTAWLSH